jgi:hypothetical protein
LSWGYKSFRSENWIQAALIASAIPSLLSIFIEYSGNAGISATSRLPSNLFFICKILVVPLVWSWLQNQPEWKYHLVYGLGIVTVLGGAVLLAIQLIVIPRPVYAEFVSDMDARFFRDDWNRLTPPSTWVFDPDPSRGPTVFGRQADSLINWGVTTSDYEALVENPDPYLLNVAGYHYIYADKDYWKQHAAQLDQPCVKVLKTVEGVKQAHGGFVPDFRRLADISECK